jgi:rhomboid protease GluP
MGLQRQGWSIDRETMYWVIARQETEGILLTTLAPGQRLNPPSSPLLENPSIKHWEAIILCPEGLSSHDLNQPILKKIQSWFIDLQTGSIFPYPPNEKQATLARVLSVLDQASMQNEFIPSSPSISQSKEHVKKSLTGQFKERPYLTFLLIITNLILFLLMTLAGGSTRSNVLVLFGAKVNSLIIQGEIWRLFTNIFLHIGFLHLSFNLYALWALGPIVEELIGRLRYIIIYLLSGISGSIISFLFVDALSAGASGAIFGLMGALVSNTRKNPSLWKSGFGKNLIIIIFLNLSLGFFQPGIDNFAHIGGLVCGLILGRLFP